MAPLYRSPQDSPYTFERISAAERDRRLRDLDKLFGPGQVEPLDIGSGSGSGSDGLRPGTFGSSRGDVGTFSPSGDGGPAGGTSEMSHSQAADAHSVVDASMAENVAGALPGIGTLSSAAVQGLSAAAGPYGVVGGPVSPAVGTPSFAQQTPAKDTPPGVPDAGAQAMAGSNTNISPQAAFGGQAAPVPDTFGFDPFGGITDAVSNVFGGDDGFAGVAANTPRGGGGTGSFGGPTGGAPGANSNPGSPGPGVGGGPNAASGGSPGGPGTGGGSAAGSGGTGAAGPDGPAGNGAGAF